jgi:hypothetical protein
MDSAPASGRKTRETRNVYLSVQREQPSQEAESSTFALGPQFPIASHLDEHKCKPSNAPISLYLREHRPGLSIANQLLCSAVNVEHPSRSSSTAESPYEKEDLNLDTFLPSTFEIYEDTVEDAASLSIDPYDLESGNRKLTQTT